MRRPDQARPSESEAGSERQDEAVLNQLSLEQTAKPAEGERWPRITEKERADMTVRLDTLNKEIPGLVEELDIIERTMGAVDVRNDVRGIAMMTENVADVVEPDVPAPNLSEEEHGKLMEAREDLTQKIQSLQWERHNLEQVLHPDEYEELESARRELGMTQNALRTFRHPGGLVGAYPAKPEKHSTALEAAPKKTGLMAKLKRFFK